ncbi:MAG: carotenoid oxygenase family protein [Alkalispirochaetaceae bacterium]
MLHPLEIYNKATLEVTEEYQDHPIETVAGAVPEGVRGVLYRNGPGRLINFGYRYDHLFDGDGMVQRFEVRDGEVRYTNRYVRTKDFEAEAAAGKPLYRSFGTNLPGGFLKNAFRMHFKNTANTHLLLLDDRLLALWEGGSPHEIDPITLETRGFYTFGGKLEPKYVGEKAMGVGRPFAAHYRHKLSTGEIYGFGLSPGIKQRLLLHKISPEKELADPIDLELPHLSFVHDFITTEDGTRVFFLVPVSFGVAAAFSGLSTPVGSIKSREGKTTVLVVTDEKITHRLESDSCYLFHMVNGYREEQSVVVDLCRMDEWPTAEDVKALLNDKVPKNPIYGILTRYVIDLSSGEVEKRQLFPHPMELPTINPDRGGRQYRYAWSIAADPQHVSEEGTLHGVAKFDLTGGTAVYRSFFPNFPGEPLFVAKPGAAEEDDGWVLMLLFNVQKRRTELLILEAASLVERYRGALPVAAHLGFHGIWTDDERYFSRG